MPQHKQTKLFCHMLIIYLGENNGPQQWQASILQLQLRYPSSYIMLQYCHFTALLHISDRIDYGQLFFTLFFGKPPGDSKF